MPIEGYGLSPNWDVEQVVVKATSGSRGADSRRGLPVLPPGSDYNYLARHVNANRLPVSAVTYCYDRIFSTAPVFSIQAEKVSRFKIFLCFLTRSHLCRSQRKRPSLPRLSAAGRFFLRPFARLPDSTGLAPREWWIVSGGLKVHVRRVTTTTHCSPLTCCDAWLRARGASR